MPKLKFIDLKTKKTFTTDKFSIKKITGGRRMAVTKAPSGVKAVVFVKKDFK